MKLKQDKCETEYVEQCQTALPAYDQLDSYGSGGEKSCQQVPVVNCQLKPRQHCEQIPRESCIDVPSTSCSQVPLETCTTTPVTSCQKVPKNNCFDVVENVCSQVETPNCELLTLRTCQVSISPTFYKQLFPQISFCQNITNLHCKQVKAGQNTMGP